MSESILSYNSDWIEYGGATLSVVDTPPVDPYNPLNLPPYTLRLLYEDNHTPTFVRGTSTQVSVSPNIWDVTTSNWYDLCRMHQRLLEVLGANATGVTHMTNLFGGCIKLTKVPLFDTSSAILMFGMFEICPLTDIPLYNTEHATDVRRMFYGCAVVKHGAFALYSQMSSQANPPGNHWDCFKNCGRDTVTGAAELAQIPQDWGGTAT